jgi:hypothetical protein
MQQFKNISVTKVRKKSVMVLQQLLLLLPASSLFPFNPVSMHTNTGNMNSGFSFGNGIAPNNVPNNGGPTYFW